MSNPSEAPSCALPPHLQAWRSLVTRSIAAWEDLDRDEQTTNKDLPRFMLRQYHSLDNFLQDGRHLMFWFFQQRSAFMSQNRIKKWSPDELDDYLLLPASPGFVMRQDCFSLAISGARRITLTQTESICAFIKLSSNRTHGRTFG